MSVIYTLIRDKSINENTFIIYKSNHLSWQISSKILPKYVSFGANILYDYFYTNFYINC